MGLRERASVCALLVSVLRVSTRNLEGVRAINNLIAVEPSRIAPRKLRSAIDGALARHADHASKHIQIAVTDVGVAAGGWPIIRTLGMRTSADVGKWLA